MNDPTDLLEGKFSAEHRAVLQQTEIDERLTGPLLKNAETLIDTIGSGLRTTSAYFALPQRVLVGLNEAMTEPLPHDLKRPQLRSFPTLMGLFMLLRGSGLAVGQTKPKRMVLIDPAMLEQWRSLNPTERYFSLVACCLCDASWDCVGLPSRWNTGLIGEIRDLYLNLRKPITVVSGDPYGIFCGTERLVVACLLHLFGWIRLEFDAKPKPGSAASVRRIERTGFGDAMFVATCNFRSPRNEESDDLHKKLQPIFPAWTKTLTRPKPEFREGDHIFKVSIGETWRRILAPADVDLDQFADAILAAFRFDHDHLYQFELRDASGNSITIGGPHLDETTYFAEKMRIGGVPLLIGEPMVFRYDFGDDWLFNVTLEEVTEGKAGKLKVTEQSGKPPKQYERY